MLKVASTTIFDNSAKVVFTTFTSLPSSMPTSVSVSGPSGLNPYTGLYNYRVALSGNSVTIY